MDAGAGRNRTPQPEGARPIGGSAMHAQST
jgi:hypothetical protein